MKKLTKRGFTIVELVIVMAVIAILAAVMIPTFSGVISDAKESAAVSGASNAYTEYLSKHAKDEVVVDDFIFDAGNGKVVLIENGQVVQEEGEEGEEGEYKYYDTLDAAKAALKGEDDAVTVTATEVDGIDGLYTYVVTPAAEG